MLFERNGQNSMDCYGQLMGTEILRKDTIGGNGAFSLFQFTHAISVYFSLLPVFFRMQRYDAE